MLVKVMDRKWIDLAVNEGEFLFKPSGFFRDLEKDDPRFDPDDNRPWTQDMSEWVNSGGGFVLEDGTGIAPGALRFFTPKARVVVRKGGNHCIYCFSSITKGNHEEYLANDLSRWGDSAIVIHDVNKLAKRFEKQLPLIDNFFEKTLTHRPVEYIPGSEFNKLSPPINPFIKHEKYMSQIEYRFAYTGPLGHTKVSIGSIKDIASVVPLTEFAEYVADQLQAEQSL